MKEFDNLKAYLPAPVVQHIVERADKEQALVPPEVQTINAVVLFADLCGFTPLSENLSSFGIEGVEELATQLNKYIGLLVKLTSRAGGDVLKFAGDAMLALWHDESEKDLAQTVQRAVQCALDMQLRLTNFLFKFHERDAEGRDIADRVRYEGELNVKIGIGIGSVKILHIGGESDNIMNERYEYVALGPALEQAFVSESFCKPGQVVVSRSAYQLVRNHFESTLIKESKSAHCRLVSDWKTEVRWRRLGNKDDDNKVPSLLGEQRLWKYVPAAVMPYLHESNEFWAPELRRVTILFCGLGLKETDLSDPMAVQNVFQRMQQSVFQYEGTINKFIVDDKGSSLISVFGLPPFAHENDPTRGVLSAMSVLSHLHEIERIGGVGITTGVAFCGVVGTRGGRREFSVIGDVVNTAARFMISAKKKKKGHYMDRATALAVRDDLNTIEAGAVELKGKKAPVDVFQVVQHAKPGGQEGAYHDQLNSPDSRKKRANSGKKLKKKRTLLTKDDKSGSFGPSSPRPRQKTNVMAKAQRDQVDAITAHPKLRKERDDLLKKKNEGGNSRDEQVANVRMAGAIDSFAQTIKSTGTPMLNVNKNRKVRAAKVRFDNAAETNGNGGGGGGSSSTTAGVSTTITVAITQDMNFVYDVKMHALKKLRDRTLLRNPSADPAVFAFQWADDRRLLRDDVALDDFAEILSLVLVERDSAVPGNPRPSAPAQAPSPTRAAHAGNGHGGSGGGGGGGAGGALEELEPCVSSDPNVIQERLEEARNALMRNGKSSMVVMEGAQGVGKTRIVKAVFLEGSSLQARTAVAMGNPYETALLARHFSVWGVLLQQILEEAYGAEGNSAEASLAGTEKESIQAIIKRCIVDADPNVDYAKLQKVLPHLDKILNTDFGAAYPSSPHPRGSTNNLFLTTPPPEPDPDVVPLLAKVIVGLSRDAPIVALVDDSHFMDIWSWRVTLELAKNWMPTSRIMVVLLHRSLASMDGPAVGDRAAESSKIDVFEGVDRHNMRAINNPHTQRRRDVSNMYEQLRKQPITMYMEKLPDPEQTEEIIQDRLGVTEVPKVLVELVKSKSKGNPLFVRDAVEVYEAEGIIRVQDKRVVLTERFEKLSKYHELPVPTVVEGICSAMLDTMSTTQQIALKVAAMIGVTFTLRMVVSVFPISALKAQVEDEFHELVKLGVIERVDPRNVKNMRSDSWDADDDRRGSVSSKGSKSSKAHGVDLDDDGKQGETGPGGRLELFQFSIGWMLETLRNRMLLKQRRKLLEIYRLIVRKEEEVNRQQFMAQTSIVRFSFRFFFFGCF